MTGRVNLLPRQKELRWVFTEMLNALGRKDFDTFETFIAEEAVFEWPYPPVDGFDGMMKGRAKFRKFCEAGMADCAPYAYSIEQIHDQALPDMLIAEYSSHSFYHPRKIEYANKYLGIFRFEGERITYWKEYLNPLIVKRVYGEAFDNAAGMG
jgi:ketosteroid isomerase-like protein